MNDLAAFITDLHRAAPEPESEMAGLARKLLAAEKAFNLYCSASNVDLSEGKFGRLEDAYFDARQAILDHLLYEHGLTKQEVTALAGAL